MMLLLRSDLTQNYAFSGINTEIQRYNIIFVEINLKMAKKKYLKPSPNPVLPRKYRQIFTLNEKENNALNRFLEKYKIKNKSKFIRETLMTEIIRKTEADQPTLFDNIK